MATLLQTCRVSPPPPSATATAELTLPLTFFDIWWVHFHPIRRILFYDHPCSKSEFLTTIIPNLKQSLSLTLKHYLPAAGHLLYPSDTDNKPLIRYSAGDSVQLTIAESDRDFDELTASHARDSDLFHDFVPELPAVEDGGDYKLVPLMALQATLLPGRGICLGIVNHHILGDGSSVNASLIFAWASMNKFGGDEEFLKEKCESLPNFDRSVVKDPIGINRIFWEVMKQTPFSPPASIPLPTNRVRATYALNRIQIEKLKNRVLAEKPGLDRVSSFVVTVCYVWSCLVKSGDDGDVFELLVIPVETRGRKNALIDPPIPANYFGNCIAFAVSMIKHDELTGEGGFAAAVEVVAEEIKNKINNASELLKGAENWLSEMAKCQKLGMRVFGVSGSPKFDLSVADFGWGRAKKLEYVTLDGENYSMSLCNSREGGGLEFGLSLPKERMEAFAALFANGLGHE